MRAVTLQTVCQMAQQAKNALWRAARENGRDICIYLHWSEGHYGQFSDSYHFMVDQDGKIYTETDNLAKPKNHTWHRNSGALDLCVLGAYRATVKNLGPEAPTKVQYEALARTAAVLARVLDVKMEGIITHAEAALLDGYGPGSGDPETRWDLWFLKNGDAPGTGGKILREMISGCAGGGELDWVFN